MAKVKIRKVKPEDFAPQAHLERKEDPVYMITPKGCAYLALADCGVEVDEIDFEHFWTQFCTILENTGYYIME